MHRGAWRVHGVLSVSRSIGDAHLKDWVLAEPDTKVLPLTSDMEYLVLASDGLWDEVSKHMHLNEKTTILVELICGPVQVFFLSLEFMIVCCCIEDILRAHTHT